MNAINGFKKARIKLYSLDVFSEVDFAAAEAKGATEQG